MIGFVVNPIAGMGGKVALKGTDGMVEEAIKRGASPVSPEIAVRFLQSLKSRPLFLSASGKMGGDYLMKSGQDFRLIYNAPESSSAEDTGKSVSHMVEEGAELIVFVGGDGTARDVVNAAGEIPVLGIPAGVKMYSSCFAYSPESAATIVDAFMEGRSSVRDAEVLDIDEEAYRRGDFRVRLYAYARVPYISGALQSAKAEYSGPDEEASKEEIAQYILENMEPGVLYIIGAGSTTAAIATLMEEDSTLLGIDAYLDKKLIEKDLGETDILRLLDKYAEARLVISPIGAQGFIFGRGNQQLSPEVIRRIGKNNVILISTPGKLSATPELHIYTGEKDLDDSFRGYIRVLTGYGRWKMKKIV